jgi:hypothetical protein
MASRGWRLCAVAMCVVRWFAGPLVRWFAGPLARSLWYREERGAEEQEGKVERWKGGKVARIRVVADGPDAEHHGVCPKAVGRRSEHHQGESIRGGHGGSDCVLTEDAKWLI